MQSVDASQDVGVRCVRLRDNGRRKTPLCLPASDLCNSGKAKCRHTFRASPSLSIIIIINDITTTAIKAVLVSYECRLWTKVRPSMTLSASAISVDNLSLTDCRPACLPSLLPPPWPPLPQRRHFFFYSSSCWSVRSVFSFALPSSFSSSSSFSLRTHRLCGRHLYIVNVHPVEVESKSLFSRLSCLSEYYLGRHSKMGRSNSPRVLVYKKWPTALNNMNKNIVS